MFGNLTGPDKGVCQMRNQCPATRPDRPTVVVKAWLMDALQTILAWRRRATILQPGDLSAHLLQDIGLSDGPSHPCRHP
jgi:uncharacterized protein YjiS (DUF1127 family)